MPYRKEIDGLRALAVVSVILFHGGFAFFGGGFVGVDVFFVISGFLITTILLEDIRTGSFSLVEFYERRARRILPALIFVVACCLPFAWLWIMPAEFRAFSDSLVAVSLSGANFLFWFKSGYFAPEAGEIPLLHTWSLAVEEQYYMLFPLLLILLAKLAPRRLPLCLIAIACTSLLYSEWASRAYPSANFYLLPSRAWEFLAGSICSILQERRLRRGNDLLALLGLALIVFSVLHFDEASPIPSLLGLVPIIGTMLVLLFARQGTGVARLLSGRIPSGIGKISYSAYLWHQPLFAFARIRSLDAPPPSTIALLACLSLVLAYFSWRFVEQPFRGKGAWLSFRGVVVSASAVLLLFISLGVYGHDTRGIPWRLPSPISDFVARNEWSKHCLVADRANWDRLPIKDCIFNGGFTEKYAILGDSVASSLTPALAHQLGDAGIALEQITHSFCAPLMGVAIHNRRASDCGTFNAEAVDLLVRSDVKTVVLAASWQAFFSQQGYDFDGTEAERSDAGPRLRAALDKTVHELTSAGIRVIIVYPHPIGDSPVVAKAAKLMHKGVAKPTISISTDEFRRQASEAYAYLDGPGEQDVVRIHPAEAFCGQVESGRCDLARDGRAYVFDEVHFTPGGAELVAGQIMERIRESEAPTTKLSFGDPSHVMN
ncbi:acyltransferase family protein [Rhizobium sp. BK251]|uniref:acyltransferase family protein n=1 Tax=Rhizobium sp. BK251 TaxID=2512125 RepID=UPI001044AD79|nr:acyltransferase family protein [Rhizobium sp. BK251]TCL70346.1 peptidoglycan/LPS O-acetylase OafA/YrhL [Rhizobium sp. BK251]